MLHVVESAEGCPVVCDEPHSLCFLLFSFLICRPNQNCGLSKSISQSRAHLQTNPELSYTQKMQQGLLSCFIPAVHRFICHIPGCSTCINGSFYEKVQTQGSESHLPSSGRANMRLFSTFKRSKSLFTSGSAIRRRHSAASSSRNASTLKTSTSG